MKEDCVTQVAAFTLTARPDQFHSVPLVARGSVATRTRELWSGSCEYPRLVL
jgi:hypothetical protein